MNDNLAFFSQAEGNLLIRLLLAHITADFMFQTSSMVAQKKWFSKQMLAHIVIVFILTAILSCHPLLAMAIAILHWLIDGTKIEIQKRKIVSGTALFASDQLLHVISVVLLWSVFSHNFAALIKAMLLPFCNYRCSLILLGYVLVTTPVGYLIKHATRGMNGGNDNTVQHGGMWIGVYERIIIFTFVLLAQYAAIGFLITGKSIIRFANKDEHIGSEYVLVGTMMSYALSILTGAAINWLLTL